MTTTMDMFKARAQLLITMTWLLGVIGITVAGARGLIDTSKIDMPQLWTLTGVVLFFWFNRSRDTDTTNAPTNALSGTTVTVKDPNAKA